MSLSKEDKEYLEYYIEVEGFEYCFLDYTDCSDIDNKNLQKAVANFRKAKKELEKVLTDLGVEYN